MTGPSPVRTRESLPVVSRSTRCALPSCAPVAWTNALCTATHGLEPRPTFELLRPIAAPIELASLRVVTSDVAVGAVDLMASVLQHCGCDVRSTTCLDDALGVLHEHRPDVFIVNAAMLDHRGHRLADKFSRLARSLGAPFPGLALMCCSEVDYHTFKRCAHAMRLRRPIDPEILVSVVQALALLRQDSFPSHCPFADGQC